MASGRDIRAGRATIEVGLRDRIDRQATKIKAKVQNLGRTLAKVGAAGLAAATAVATPFAAGIVEFARFESALANVASLLDDTSSMEGFREGIRRLSVEFGESTDSLARGLYDIISASVPAEDALTVLATATKAAKAGLTDTGTAADVITTLLNSYGIAASDAGRVSDVLFATVKKGKTTFEELAGFLGQVASVAASAGVSLEETGAFLALLTRNGLSTANAVTSLRGIITSFLKPTDDARKVADQYGLSLSAATLESEGLAGALNKLNGLSPDELARIFPNVEALKGVLPALQNFEQLQGDLKATAESAGATDKAFKTMSSTLTFLKDKIVAAKDVLFGIVGESIVSDIAAVAKVVSGVADSFVSWAKDNQPLIRTIFYITAGVAAASAALLAAGVVAIGFGAAIGGIITTISALITATTIVAGVVASAVAAVASLAASIGLIGIPIGLAVAAVGALIAQFVDFGSIAKTVSANVGIAIGGISRYFSELKEDAKETFGAIADALSAGNIQLAAKVLWSALKLEWQKGKTALITIWESLKATMVNVAIDVYAGIARAAIVAVSRIRDAFALASTFIAKAFFWAVSQSKRALNNLLYYVDLVLQSTKALFDSDFGIEDAQAKAAQELERREKNRKQSATDAQDILDANAAKDKEQRAEQEQRVLDAADSIAEVLKNAVNLGRNEAIATAEREVAEARKEWQEAVEAARKAKEEASTQVDKTKKEQQKQEVEKAKQTAKQQATGSSAQGLFNIAAIQSLLVGDHDERIAKATEATAGNTDEIRRNMNKGRPIFG